MKINKLQNNIKYKELEHSENWTFSELALKNNYYSDLNFINYFKDKRHGKIFWQDVILFTTLPIKTIFSKYENYFSNAADFDFDFNTFYKRIIYYEAWHLGLTQKHFDRALKNVETFINIYEKIKKINRY